ncbi:MAG: glycosyltransferase family 25 protein [Bacteroides sp.]|nr:glycosyltransferase family 25 protein [Bacteroides sp.]
MKRIKTYVINLPHAVVRRKYMEELLSSKDIFDVEFLEAVDGRNLTDNERRNCFDYDSCVRLIGRELNDGEVGCTLSHRKAYAALLASEYDYAIVFEDDISFMRNPESLVSLDLDSVLITETPRVVMLSGDYWFWSKGKIVSVYDCNGAYAYIINRAAAGLLLSRPACCVSDQWSHYKTYGLDIKAVHPYIVDANLSMDLLSSDVEQDTWGINRRRMDIRAIIDSYVAAILRRTLKMTGHFESKIRVLHNKIVEN